MLLDIAIPVGSVTRNCRYNINLQNKEFPIISADIDSYIVSGKILSGINLCSEMGIHNIQLGRFNACSNNIMFMVDANHDYKSVHQGTIQNIPLGNHTNVNRKGQIIIENNCWVGYGATINAGVTIHDGAVVGANAMVTKDVPPFAIVAGNPAKIVGYRFSQEIIEKLLTIRWWDWSKEEIVARAEDICADVEKFIDKYYVPPVKKENPVPRMTKGKRYVFYCDLEEGFPVFRRMMDSFVQSFDGTDAELLLYINPKRCNVDSTLTEISTYFEKYVDKSCYINIYTEPLDDETDLLIDSDYYISNRQLENVHRMCMARFYGTSCLSGVDSCPFCCI